MISFRYSILTIPVQSIITESNIMFSITPQVILSRLNQVSRCSAFDFIEVWSRLDVLILQLSRWNKSYEWKFILNLEFSRAQGQKREISDHNLHSYEACILGYYVKLTHLSGFIACVDYGVENWNWNNFDHIKYLWNFHHHIHTFVILSKPKFIHHRFLEILMMVSNTQHAQCYLCCGLADLRS